MFLKADCSGNDSFVYKAITFPTAWWFQADVYIPASTFAAIPWYLTAWPLIVSNGSIWSYRDFAAVQVGDGTAGGWSDPASLECKRAYYPNITIASVFSYDAWHTVKIHYDGTNLTWYLDGTEVATTSGIPSLTPNGIAVGGINSQVQPNEVYHIDNVKLGTTDGGVDIFADDFESGDLSAWDGDEGSNTPTIVSSFTSGSYTLSATPDTTSVVVPGASGTLTRTVTVTIGQVGSSESVDLSLSTSSPAPGVTASLDVSTVTTPGSAVLTWEIDPASATVGTCSVTIEADDGTLHDAVTVSLELQGDYTLEASPATLNVDLPATAPTTVTETVTVTVGAVSGPETVNLSLDTITPAPGIAAALDVASVTTPGTATLTLTFDRDSAEVGTTSVVIQADDGFFQTSVVVSVTVRTTGPVTPYDLLPTAPMQAGSNLTISDIPHDVTLCEHAGDLYAAWVETHLEPTYELGYEYTHGPYLARWDEPSSSWVLVTSIDEPRQSDLVHDPSGHLVGYSTSPAVYHVQLASDGTNLYIGYACAYGTGDGAIATRRVVPTAPTLDDCGPDPTTGDLPGYNVPTYFVRMQKYAGGGLTDLGWFGMGQTGPDLNSLFLFNFMAIAGAYALTNYFAPDASLGGSANLQITASPDEVGSCYFAWYEDGYATGPGYSSAPGAGGFRRLWIGGFDGAYDSTVNIGGLWEPTNESTTSGCIRCAMGANSPTLGSGLGYHHWIVGSGDNLTWYGTDLSVEPGDATSHLKVWQKGGFLPDLELATVFADPYSDASAWYEQMFVVSNDLDGNRLIGVPRLLTGNAYGPLIVRSFALTDPSTPENVWGRAQFTVEQPLYATGAYPFWFEMFLAQETENVWWTQRDEVWGDSGAGAFAQLADRCGVVGWAGARPPTGTFGPTQTKVVLHQDAFWGVKDDGTTSASIWRIPICRGCGLCGGGGARIWQRF